MRSSRVASSASTPISRIVVTKKKKPTSFVRVLESGVGDVAASPSSSSSSVAMSVAVAVAVAVAHAQTAQEAE